MIEQYLKIKAQYEDAFLFFRLGDFYELFFEDAKLAAEELEITLTGRDGGAEERIPMCGVPFHSANTYVEKLIDKGYKVAICEQVEDPSTAKGVVKREVIRVITPGTIMEESMLQDQENNFLVTVTSSDDRYAVSAVDLSTGEIHLTELVSVSSLVDEIVSYQPKEVVIEETLTGSLTPILHKRLKVLITPIELNSHRQEQVEKDIMLQFSTYQEECNTPSLRKVLIYLYAYLQQTQKRSLGHLQRIHRYDAMHYMTLDEVARRNLELTATMGEGKKRGSLLWLLNRTATAMGSRLLKKWLDKPLLHLPEIEGRQEVVAAYLEHLVLSEEIRDTLKSVYDLERLVARVSFGTATARDLTALRRSLEMVPILKQLLSQLESEQVSNMIEQMDECADLSAWIAESIVDEPPISVKEGGIIRDGFHELLDQYRDVQANGKQWIAQLEQQEREATGIKNLKIGYNRVFGYYIEITKSHLRNLPEGRYERKQTLANAERFITAELKEKEQLILQASEKSVDLEYDLFSQVRNQIAGQVVRIQKLADMIAELDVLHAFAHVSAEFGYIRPKIHTGDQLYIVGGRHPVVEAVVREEEFVSNDVELNAESRQIYLITGPNMAGKSTYMRQVALITILGQIGCYVPATEAKIPVVDRIFTRIGAADDLVGGRSTFMVEMAETCQALKEATPRSLILLDEVGRGTSTYDGLALAHAIVEYIHEYVKAKTLFSTHYHELTQLEASLPRLVNVHAKCIEKDGKVVFLHRIVSGGADRSYGIHVAELAGLPTPVIERAKVILSHLEDTGHAETAVTELRQAESKPVVVENSVPVAVVETIEEESGGYRLSEDPDGQLSLFDFKDQNDVIHNQSPIHFVDKVQPIKQETLLSSNEQEVLLQLQRFDLMNHTPFEAMKFVLDLQRKLLK